MKRVRKLVDTLNEVKGEIRAAGLDCWIGYIASWARTTPTRRLCVMMRSDDPKADQAGERALIEAMQAGRLLNSDLIFVGDPITRDLTLLILGGDDTYSYRSFSR
ncbi:MAG: hypothetical protein R3E01_19835 [Pirellulaceae bacterium]